MPLQVTGITDTGVKRTSNQDSIAWYTSRNNHSVLGIVADGMGGYKGGEIASQIAVNTITDALMTQLEQGPQSTDARIDAIHTAFTLANEQIQALRQEDAILSQMGTTVVLCWVQDDQAIIAHIGDSRCYLLSEDELAVQTRDDTVVQSMLDDGSITETDAPRTPFRNVLTRALGSTASVSASIRTLTLAQGDQLILCSDGLTDAVPDDQWPPLLKPAHTMDQQVRTLLDTSLENQAADNVSVVLIRMES
ncbi:PP2C family protein-serine/threonine phosphatase [Marinobacter sp. 1Y8]